MKGSQYILLFVGLGFRHKPYEVWLWFHQALVSRVQGFRVSGFRDSGR